MWEENSCLCHDNLYCSDTHADTHTLIYTPGKTRTSIHLTSIRDRAEYKRKSLSESIPRGILYLYQHIGRERDGRDDRIRTCDLCVPNAALYQTEPHLDKLILIDLYIISHDFRFVKGFCEKNTVFGKILRLHNAHCLQIGMWSGFEGA